MASADFPRAGDADREFAAGQKVSDEHRLLVFCQQVAADGFAKLPDP